MYGSDFSFTRLDEQSEADVGIELITTPMKSSTYEAQCQTLKSLLPHRIFFEASTLRPLSHAS